MSIIDIPLQLELNWLRQKYTNNELTPQELIQVIIERANNEKDKNIWITPPSLDRIQPYLEKLKEPNFEEFPLWGIPFAVKDNIDVVGFETTAGCEKYAYVPTEQATIIQKLIDAGAIPIGKTNLDQFATGLVGTRSPYGETHNALKSELISGGSSSGSAVAVACGQAVFSLGTDTAGSGRVPAGLNRLVGFKPSLGAWSTKGLVYACESLDCIMVFAHSLNDALMVDQVVRGVDEYHPWSKEFKRIIPSYPKRVLLPKDSLTFYGPYASEYKAAWEKAVSKIEQLPIKVDYISVELFNQAATILYGGPWVAERWSAVGNFIKNNPNAAFPVTEQILKSSNQHDAASVFHAMHYLQKCKLEVKRLLDDAVLILPTSGGTWTRKEVRENPIDTNSQMGLYTNHCNLLDLCAVAIPGEDAAEAVPFGVTAFALSEHESLIFGAAALFTGESIEKGAVSGDDMTLVAVCGLHMRGLAFEQQMKDCGARFIEATTTSHSYKLLKLHTTPAKPGLIKVTVGGEAIELEVWEMPLVTFGSFVASIPAPLGFGKVQLQDGREIPGFLCEPYAEQIAEDITVHKGWRNFLNIVTQ